MTRRYPALPTQPAERGRKFAVESGHETDACPNCGIHRRYAGYFEATCGRGFREPGCFVKPKDHE